MTNPANVTVSDALDAAYRRAGDGFQDANRTISSDTTSTEGIDPSTAESIAASKKKTKEELERAEKAARKGREHGKDQEEEADEAAAKQKGTDTSGINADGKGGPGTNTSGDKAAPSAQPASNTGGGGSPTAQAQPAANSGGGGGSPSGGAPQSQVGMPSYNPSSLPTAATANQADMNNAPNRDALRAQIQDAVNNGNWGTGQAGDDRPSKGGGGTVDTGQAEGEYEKKVLEAIDKAVNSQPPIPYAWGGGHGGTPGPSQGTTDGGYADQMGDYNKIGVDCSGFTAWMFYEATGSTAAMGTSQAQYGMGQAVTDPRPGDFVFPQSAGRPPMHVQMYIGNGKVAEAQMSGTDLMISDLQEGSEFRRLQSS